MASSTATTPLVLHDDPAIRQEQLLAESSAAGRRHLSVAKVLSGILVSILVVCAVVAVIHINQSNKPHEPNNNVENKPSSATMFTTESQKVDHMKPIITVNLETNAEVEWERSVYHFQPDKNFISDPDGPMYHMGWYHLFYQYNPKSAIWGNITWGHSVSRDMINWYHLPFAMVPDHWYDIEGVMTGSATVLPNGQIIMLYTGNAYDLSQLQCLAYAVNSSDPLLIEWKKYEGNPVLFPPPGVGFKDFRDPSTLWMGPDGKYRMVMGSKHNETIGCALIYHTTNFTHFELLEEPLHAVPHTGMWECVDLYPVSTTHTYGLDIAVDNGPNVKYVLKQSGDEDRHDWYAIGTYDIVKDKWYPDDPENDVGLGLRYDFGKFYASKTFYDQHKKRRVLWGYVGETDPQTYDLSKGWANILNIPRTIVLDTKTQSNLIQWPIEETEKLRSKKFDEFKDVELHPGSLVPLEIGTATQLDIVATFEVDQKMLESTLEADVLFNCTTSAGSVGRGVLGPFGVVVLADAERSEQLPVYFYIAKDTDGSSKTYFCSDETRSSKDKNVGTWVYGSSVPVLEGESYNMRLLVDHSIVEGFAQGGRTVVTSRVYPTKAIYGAAKMFLFNNATGISVKASLKIWKMGEAQLDPYPLDGWTS
uniref:beta-fructofuranosidase, soluble isoenzyme I-like n=1 Tax=Erigeron canadensis TaxID=72917 RepID=UPI001CB9470E|nr:beta-fructofuranosidase, soluble isoenzyme I-like [Erigeron canadensis]